MLIIFIKAIQPDPDRDDEGEEDDDALDKIRAGFVDDVKKAKKKEDREHAEDRLRRLDAGQ
jgi:hypothetical protein